ncbi:MAG: DUF2799 domain-containing protein [Zoogloea sp.]|nr:DUF2799 domain-containing protein [Zoogloea sp.]MCA0186012.1 DUF2799 domain-containing protein [Pseudomonadota bacterium]
MSPFSACMLTLAVLSLGACATLDEQECRSANWRELGLRDGRMGYPASRLAEHQEACAEFGIRPDPGAYARGRLDGLDGYCQPRNAVQEGLAGRSYQLGVCPPGKEPAFVALHRAAYEVHQSRARISTLNGQSDSIERELRSDKLSDERRARLRHELRDLDRDLRRERDQLRWKESDLDRLSGRPGY